MHVVCVDFEVKPGHLAEFMPLMKAQAKNSLELEDGCRRFDVSIDREDGCKVFLYEIYDSEEAFQSHLASDHFKAFDKAVAGMVAGKTVRTMELA